ncbi:MAG: TrkA family potassium uptake protein, partial [Oscillospiraceae bacterium]
RFGYALAKTLSDEGKDVMVVDRNEDKIQAATAFTDNAFLVSAPTKEILEEIGIQNCDTVIVCIGEKIDTSILTTLTVINLGIKRVISKAISHEQGSVLRKLGAEVVYPERDMAIRLAHKLLAPNILEDIELNDEINITEMKLTEKMGGLSIVDVELRKNFGLNVIAVKRDGGITIDIGPTFIFNKDDEVVLVGKRDNIEKFEKFLTK